MSALAQHDAAKAHLDSAMLRARNHAAMLSVLCVDLADLRPLAPANAEWEGSPASSSFADRLRRCARRNDLIAPLDGDVCMIVAEFMEGPHAAHRMADRILSVLQQLPASKTPTAQRGASIGIATASGAQLEGEHPLRRAHRAMLRARLEGGNRRIVADVSV